jgi:hypothetical protein
VSRELVFTSAPRGVKPGSQGFCTVAYTQGMPANLIQQLESLSSYRHIFSPQDPKASLNPVAYSHLILGVAGRRCHVLSRICDAGLDYTQRTNKFAHHIILDAAEVPAAGPAWLLAQPKFMRSQWAGEPSVLPAGPAVPSGPSALRVCLAWQQITGDAGWAGALAQTAASPTNGQATIVFQPGMDILSLLAESLSLLPAERRWQVAFSTYFTKLPPGVGCQWRCVADGTPEAAAARQPRQTGLVIDLCRPVGQAAGGNYVEMARTGRQPAITNIGEQLPDAELEYALRLANSPEINSGIDLAALPCSQVPIPPPVVGGRPPRHQVPHPKRKRLPLWLWVFGAVASILILAAFGLAVKVGAMAAADRKAAEELKTAVDKKIDDTDERAEAEIHVAKVAKEAAGKARESAAKAKKAGDEGHKLFADVEQHIAEATKAGDHKVSKAIANAAGNTREAAAAAKSASDKAVQAAEKAEKAARAAEDSASNAANAMDRAKKSIDKAKDIIVRATTPDIRQCAQQAQKQLAIADTAIADAKKGGADNATRAAIQADKEARDAAADAEKAGGKAQRMRAELDEVVAEAKNAADQNGSTGTAELAASTGKPVASAKTPNSNPFIDLKKAVSVGEYRAAMVDPTADTEMDLGKIDVGSDGCRFKDVQVELLGTADVFARPATCRLEKEVHADYISWNAQLEPSKGEVPETFANILLYKDGVLAFKWNAGLHKWKALLDSFENCLIKLSTSNDPPKTQLIRLRTADCVDSVRFELKERRIIAALTNLGEGARPLLRIIKVDGLPNDKSLNAIFSPEKDKTGEDDRSRWQITFGQNNTICYSVHVTAASEGRSIVVMKYEGVILDKPDEWSHLKPNVKENEEYHKLTIQIVTDQKNTMYSKRMEVKNNNDSIQGKINQFGHGNTPDEKRRQKEWQRKLSGGQDEERKLQRKEDDADMLFNRLDAIQRATLKFAVYIPVNGNEVGLATTDREYDYGNGHARDGKE